MSNPFEEEEWDDFASFDTPTGAASGTDGNSETQDATSTADLQPTPLHSQNNFESAFPDNAIDQGLSLSYSQAVDSPPDGISVGNLTPNSAFISEVSPFSASPSGQTSQQFEIDDASRNILPVEPAVMNNVVVEDDDEWDDFAGPTFDASAQATSPTEVKLELSSTNAFPETKILQPGQQESFGGRSSMQFESSLEAPIVDSTVIEAMSETVTATPDAEPVSSAVVGSSLSSAAPAPSVVEVEEDEWDEFESHSPVPPPIAHTEVSPTGAEIEGSFHSNQVSPVPIPAVSTENAAVADQSEVTVGGLTSVSSTIQQSLADHDDPFVDISFEQSAPVITEPASALIAAAEETPVVKEDVVVAAEDAPPIAAAVGAVDISAPDSPLAASTKESPFTASAVAEPSALNASRVTADNSICASVSVELESLDPFAELAFEVSVPITPVSPPAEPALVSNTALILPTAGVAETDANDTPTVPEVLPTAAVLSSAETEADLLPVISTDADTASVIDAYVPVVDVVEKEKPTIKQNTETTQPSDDSAVEPTVAEKAEQDAIQNVTTEVALEDPVALLIAPEVSSTAASTIATDASAAAVTAVDVIAPAIDGAARVEPAHLEEASPATVAIDDVTNVTTIGQTVTDSTVPEDAVSTVEVEAAAPDAIPPAITEPSCDVIESVTFAAVTPSVDVQVVEETPVQVLMEDQDEVDDPFGQLVAAPVISLGADAEVGVNTAESSPCSEPLSAPASSTTVPSEQRSVDNTGNVAETAKEESVSESKVVEEVENVSAVTSALVADDMMKAETQLHEEEETSVEKTEQIDTITTSATTPSATATTTAGEVDIAAVSQVPVPEQEPVSTEAFSDGKVEAKGEMELEVPVAPVVGVEEEGEKDGEERREEKRDKGVEEEVDPFGELSFQQTSDPISISPVIPGPGVDADPFVDISFVIAPVLESNATVDPLSELIFKPALQEQQADQVSVQLFAGEQKVEQKQEEEEDEWDDFEGPTSAATSPVPDTITAVTAFDGEVVVDTRLEEVPAANTCDVVPVSAAVIEEDIFDDFAAPAPAFDPTPAPVVNTIDHTPSVEPSVQLADVDVTAALNGSVTSSELNLARNSNNNEMEEDGEWDAFEGPVATTTAPITPSDYTIATDGAAVTSANVDSAPFPATATATSATAFANGIVNGSSAFINGAVDSDFTFAAFESNTEPVNAAGNSFEASFDVSNGDVFGSAAGAEDEDEWAAFEDHSTTFVAANSSTAATTFTTANNNIPATTSAVHSVDTSSDGFGAFEANFDSPAVMAPHTAAEFENNFAAFDDAPTAVANSFNSTSSTKDKDSVSASNNTFAAFPTTADSFPTTTAATASTKAVPVSTNSVDFYSPATLQILSNSVTTGNDVSDMQYLATLPGLQFSEDQRRAYAAVASLSSNLFTSNSNCNSNNSGSNAGENVAVLTALTQRNSLHQPLGQFDVDPASRITLSTTTVTTSTIAMDTSAPLRLEATLQSMLSEAVPADALSLEQLALLLEALEMKSTAGKKKHTPVAGPNNSSSNNNKPPLAARSTSSSGDRKRHDSDASAANKAPAAATNSTSATTSDQSGSSSPLDYLFGRKGITTTTASTTAATVTGTANVNNGSSRGGSTSPVPGAHSPAQRKSSFLSLTAALSAATSTATNINSNTTNTSGSNSEGHGSRKGSSAATHGGATAAAGASSINTTSTSAASSAATPAIVARLAKERSLDESYFGDNSSNMNLSPAALDFINSLPDLAYLLH